MRDEKPLDLTSFEQRILRYLMERAGETVNRVELVQHIYAQDFERDSNTIEVLMRRLRVKIGVNAIETVRGKGYRMRRDV